MVYFRREYAAIEDSGDVAVVRFDDIDIIGRNTASSTRCNNNHAPKKMMFTGLCLLFVFCGASLLLTGSTSSTTSLDTTVATSNVLHIPLLGKRKPKQKKVKPPRKCKFNECYASGCDFETQAYTCITFNGEPHGGCSTYPWYKGTCDDQCDLSQCKILRVPKSEDSCKYVPCDLEWCQGNQLCPKAAPYQCLEGSAMYGCSTDRYQWMFKTPDETCSKCCDAVTCPGTEEVPEAVPEVAELQPVSEPDAAPDAEPDIGGEE